jgi:hypothetical protein
VEKLRFGVFEEFKGDTTLLLWADDTGFAELLQLFRRLVDGNMSTVRLDEMPWAESVDGTSLQFSLVSAGNESMKVSPIEHGNWVDWRCSVEQFAEAADLVEVLARPSCKTGHQYLPTTPPHPLQVMVSKGEYGPDAFLRRPARGS